MFKYFRKGTFTIIILTLLLCLYNGQFLLSKEDANDQSLLCPALTHQFYERHHNEPYWFSPDVSSIMMRRALVRLLDSACYLGLDRNKYHYDELKKNTDALALSNDQSLKEDYFFTDAALCYFKDVYCGAGINKWVSSDEVSPHHSASNDSLLLERFSAINSPDEVITLSTSLQPCDSVYNALKKELHLQLDSNHTAQIEQLDVTLNYYRWIHHFHFPQYIVVNIPSTTLYYYENDSLKLQMEVVVGKPSTKTPRFSSYCNEVILYPYWNVPRDIELRELLPEFKRKPGNANRQGIQVIDKNGKVISPDQIKWSSYNGKNFPYGFRQKTGCANSLGVIKFNLTDAFSVYMHDTNFKNAFLSRMRFLSHGCIRLQKPMELGNMLLNNTLDTTFLKACYKDMTPTTIALPHPVPVFVVYMTAEVDSSNTVTYYKDVYKLFGK